MKPHITTNRLGDRYRVWYFGRRYVEVVESTTCGGVPIPRHYFVGLVHKAKLLGRFTSRKEAFRFAERIAER